MAGRASTMDDVTYPPERRRLSVGELYLMVSAGSAAVIAALLAWAPERLTTGPALATVYGLAPRSTWAACFAVLAVLCAVGAWRPTEGRFVAILTVVVAAQALWAVGLTMPALLPGATANLLAPVAWLQLASTSVVVGLAGRHEGRPSDRGHSAPRPILPRRGHRPPAPG